ncbi:hypothetical protein [Treponema lecithinolyticum]
MFAGINPTEEKELKPLWEKWGFFFDVFLMICDRQNGNLLHLPFAGGAFVQPYKTYKVIQCIQSVYFEKITEDYEKAKANNGSSTI